MASSGDSDEFDAIYDALMPVLAEAAIGTFDTRPTIDRANTPRVNELLTGVQVLLEVIREKIDDLEAANAKLTDAHDRSVSLLDEVLRKSLE